MREITLDQIKQRLIKVGWFAERNKKQEALKQIQESITEAESQGFTIQSFSSVETFLRSFVGIEMEIFDYGEWTSYLAIEGPLGNELDAMMDLAEERKTTLFPVGLAITELNGKVYEIMEVCMDPQSRFFGIHWSGDYILGSNEWEAFQNLIIQKFTEI